MEIGLGVETGQLSTGIWDTGYIYIIYFERRPASNTSQTLTNVVPKVADWCLFVHLKA